MGFVEDITNAARETKQRTAYETALFHCSFRKGFLAPVPGNLPGHLMQALCMEEHGYHRLPVIAMDLLAYLFVVLALIALYRLLVVGIKCAYAAVVTGCYCVHSYWLLVVNPARRACLYGPIRPPADSGLPFSQESSVPGSVYSTATVPTYSASMWSIQDDGSKYLLGMVWRHGNFVLTAGHVIDSMRSEIANGHYVVLQTRSGFFAATALDWTVYPEDLAIATYVPQIQGLTSIEISPVCRSGVVASITSGYPRDNASVGSCKMADEWGCVKYFGSTRGGFSGAPYVYNGKAIGLHTTGSSGHQFGLAASHIKAVYLNKEDSEDILLRQVFDTDYADLDWRYVGADDVEVRLKNGRYMSFDAENFFTKAKQHDEEWYNEVAERMLEQAFDTRGDRVYETGLGKERVSARVMRARLAAKYKALRASLSATRGVLETGVNPAASAAPVELPGTSGSGNGQSPPQAGSSRTVNREVEFGNSLVELHLTISQQSAMISALLEKCTELTLHSAGQLERHKQLLQVSESTRSDVKRLIEGLIQAKVVSSDVRKTKPAVEVDELKKRMKSAYADFVKTLVSTGGTPESGLPSEILSDMNRLASTLGVQPFSAPSVPSIIPGLQDLVTSLVTQQLEKQLVGMEFRPTTKSGSSSSASSSVSVSKPSKGKKAPTKKKTPPPPKAPEAPTTSK